MTTRKKFFAAAEAAGISVDYRHGYTRPFSGQIVPWHIALEAPEGMVFSSGQTTVDCSLRGEDGELKPDWSWALSRLEEIIEEGFDEYDEEADADLVEIDGVY